MAKNNRSHYRKLPTNRWVTRYYREKGKKVPYYVRKRSDGSIERRKVSQVKKTFQNPSKGIVSNGIERTTKKTIRKVPLVEPISKVTRKTLDEDIVDRGIEESPAVQITRADIPISQRVKRGAKGWVKYSTVPGYITVTTYEKAKRKKKKKSR